MELFLEPTHPVRIHPLQTLLYRFSDLYIVPTAQPPRRAPDAEKEGSSSHTCCR